MLASKNIKVEYFQKLLYMLAR